MSKRGSLSEEERAELVAYLDGEASGEVKRSIEAKLSLDPIWRAEAESLKRAWDMLEFLPRPEPSPSFTQKTLSKLEPIRKPVSSPESGGAWRMTGWLVFGTGWAAAVVLAALGGYIGYQRVAKKGPGDTELIRDLRIIENRRYYQAVDDIQFLRELDQPDLFGENDTGG